MIKKLVFLALLPALLTLSGCHALLLRYYNIKNPEVENRQTMLKCAKRYGLDTAALVTVAAADYKKTYKLISGIPDVTIYDKDGRYIEYRATDTSCNAGVFGFIPQLKPGGSYNATGRASLDAQLATLRSLTGQPLALKPDGSDFYILAYWTVYGGRLNKDHVKAWQDLVKQNTHAKIHLIEVNMDWQEWWDKAEREAILPKPKS